MKERDIRQIANWLVHRGLAGDSEIVLLEGFCARCLEADLALARATLVVDTLHPVYEGRAFLWRQDGALENAVSEYESSAGGVGERNWLKSPFYYMFENGVPELRFRLGDGETSQFEVLADLAAEGQTDYIALVQKFDREAVIGEMDSVLSRWTTMKPGGFSEDEIETMRRLVPVLALAVKSASLARVAESLVETYLGRDAGRRVLQGKMSRGVVDKINAVLWFSDMKGYTSLSESLASDQIIPLLDDYADAVISAVHAKGGDVLKLIGDGVLAIFAAEDPASACRAAFRAEAGLRLRLAKLDARRAAEGAPVASIYLGLHIGDVFYGNIGSKERLDFTVIGQAVNEVSRIASMCRSADRDVLFSSEFRDCLPEPEQGDLVSVGRYALRGVGRAAELFTVDPDRRDGRKDLDAAV